MITIGTQCCIFISKSSLNFTMAKLLKLAVNYSRDLHGDNRSSPSVVEL